MDKFITYKEQELKDNLEWIETYTKSILELCNTNDPNQFIGGIKLKASSILKQLEDFNLST